MSALNNGLIAGFLILNVATPLSYYLGDDAFDERFAWRMFSPVRLARCQVRLSNGHTEIRPQAKTHQVWINLMRRARRPVFEGYARQYCAAEREAGRTPKLFVDIKCDAPDMGLIGVCRGQGRDQDRDGVPDGYLDPAADCGDLSPADCFKRDCEGDDPVTCRERLCRRTPIDRGENLCETVGVQ